MTAEEASRPTMDVDISPVLAQDPLDLRLTLTSIIHWADSREVRENAMRRADFPVDDLPMFLVVNQLTYRGALRPTDLASTLGTGKANITKIVRRLQDEGLVCRVPSEVDERSMLVALTGEGRAIGERILAQTSAAFEGVLDGWSDDDIDDLRRLLSRFARNAVLDTRFRPPSLITDSRSSREAP